MPQITARIFVKTTPEVVAERLAQRAREEDQTFDVKFARDISQALVSVIDRQSDVPWFEVNGDLCPEEIVSQANRGLGRLTR
jgi:ribose 1,5-bisphosphokinase PhnN